LTTLYKDCILAAHMAITKGAKKAVRSHARKRVFNVRRKKALHDTTKTVRDAIQKGDTDTANKELPTAYKAIDKAAKRGIIKKNTANRTKSRLTKAIAKVSK